MNNIIIALCYVMFLLNMACMLVGDTELKDLGENLNYAGQAIVWMFSGLTAMIWVATGKILEAIKAK